MNASMPVPRLCVVEKPSGDCEYGFNLHAERGRGQFVGAVDIGSPADVSGLRPGDHIVAVNAEAVAGLSHKEVVHRIKSDPTRCSLLVLDEDSVQWYKEHNVPMFAYFARRLEELENEGRTYGGEEAAKLPLAEESGGSRPIALPANDATVADSTRVPAAQIAIGSTEESPAYENLSPPVSVLSAGSASPATIPRHNRSQVEAAIPAQLQAAGPKPRLCTLIKPSPVEEFGFNLHAERGKGHFIGAVDKGGIADAAGLETGQRIVGVNDRLVSAQTPHKEIVQLIKRDPLKTVLLVASEEADRFYAEYGLVFSYDHLLLFDPLLQNGRNRLASNGSKQGQPQSSSNLRQQGTGMPNTLQEKEQKNGDRPRGMSLNGRPPTPTSTYTATPPLSPPTIAVQIQVRADNRTDIQIKEVEESLQHSPAEQTLDNVSGERQNGKHVLAGYSPEATVPSSYSPQNDVKIALSSELSHSSRRIPPEQKDNVGSNGATERDIFALSALEARQLMRGRKRDPRKEGKMTLDEKYRLILNL